jgi:DNA repair protein RecO (recombination protein O)
MCCDFRRERYDAGMIRIEPALVVAAIAHGEHGVVARFLTEELGLVAAYVPGGRGRKLRAILQHGQVVALDLVERRPGQLRQAGVHPLASNLAMIHGAGAIAMVEYLAALAAATLPEDQPHPRLFPLFAALFAAAGAGSDAPTKAAALVRLELALLADLGLGLDLASCAATGASDDLAYVSPKSRQAVSRGAGAPYAAKLLPLPAFLLAGGGGDADALADGLKLSGYFLARNLLAGNPAEARVWTARERLRGLLLA